MESRVLSLEGSWSQHQTGTASAKFHSLPDLGAPGVLPLCMLRGINVHPPALAERTNGSERLAKSRRSLKRVATNQPGCIDLHVPN